jgi:hypothetical protein
MIYSVVRLTKEEKKEIDEWVGTPYGLWYRIKQMGIGSAKMLVAEYSQHFNEYFSFVQGVKSVNVELRPKGIILHFKKRVDHYIWVIPYHMLTMYQTSRLSFYAGGHKLSVFKQYLGISHVKFFNRIRNQKAAYLAQFDYLS